MLIASYGPSRTCSHACRGATPATGSSPPPPPPRTYREWYANAAINVVPERIAGYLAGYRFAWDGDIPAPAQLRDQTVTISDRQPMAFMVLFNGQDGTPVVGIVHRLLRFMDSPGDDEPSGFHDRVGTPRRHTSSPVSCRGSHWLDLPSCGQPD